MDKSDRCVDDGIENIMLRDDFKWNSVAMRKNVITWQCIGEVIVNSKGQLKNFIDDYIEHTT